MASHTLFRTPFKKKAIKMENEPHYLLVGSVIVAVVLAMVLGLVWLSGGNRIDYVHYTIYFRNQSVDGLDVSSPVKLRGVKVGEVTDYAFVTGAQEAVQVNIKVEPGTPLQTGCRATVQRSIVTGLATIEIDNPKTKSPLIQATDSPPWPVIAEGSSNFEQVTTNLTQMSEQASQALNNINQVLGAHNQQVFAQTLDNLHTLSAQLVAHKQMLYDSLRGVQSAADALKQASDHISVTSTHLDEQMGQLSQDATTTLKQTTQTLSSVQQQSVVVSQSLQRLIGTADYQMKQLGSDVHQDSQVIKETGQRLSDPGELLFSGRTANRAPGE
jgi:phospholipid/cholesterol/gamma-HCH transport system substrate-binding protein